MNKYVVKTGLCFKRRKDAKFNFLVALCFWIFAFKVKLNSAILRSFFDHFFTQINQV
jgi:hypothetical protein